MSDQELELYIILGKYLTNLRKDNKLTAVDVSRLLNSKGFELTDTSIRRYESGKHRITMETLRALCDIYGVDYIDIIKKAKIQSIKETDSSCNVKCDSDLDPISKRYGEDSSKLLYYFNQLNSEGRSEALKRVSELSQLESYTSEKKGQEKMA